MNPNQVCGWELTSGDLWSSDCGLYVGGSRPDLCSRCKKPTRQVSSAIVQPVKTLRDEFAMCVWPDLVRGFMQPPPNVSLDRLDAEVRKRAHMACTAAYEWADAMLEARKPKA